MKKITLFLLLLSWGMANSQSGETCATAIDLGAETSPYSSTTVGAANDNGSHCGWDGSPVINTAPDLYYSISVPAGSTIRIQQSNDYDSSNIAFYGTCDDQTQIACFDDPDETEVVWANDTGSDQTFYWIQDGYSENSGSFTLTWLVFACTASEADFDIVSLCDTGAEQFNITVDVTNMGSASSLTIYDDFGNASQAATSTGLLTFGPYDNGTDVIFTIENDQDSNCTWSSDALGQNVCPPDNDDPAGAILLTLDLGSECGANAITGISNEGTSGSTEVSPSCDDYNPSFGNGDLWYTIAAPSSEFTLNTQDLTGNIYSVSGILYSGTPGNLTEVGDCSNGWPKRYSGLTQDETYYLRVWDYGNDGIGTFTLCGHYLDCVNPVATFNIVSDCDNGEQFLVNVDVTSIGSATSVTVSDDQGNASQGLTATGMLSFGPYPNDTDVIFTINNDDNMLCFLTSNEINQVACPPVNDTCATAIDLGTQTSPLVGNTIGAINDNGSHCGYDGDPVTNTAPDIFYSIEVPVGSTLTIGQTSNEYDSTNVAFYGDCTNRTQISCFDDDDFTQVVWANNTGSSQTVYWIQDGYSSNYGEFTLEWSVVSCSSPVVEFNVVSDCANGDQFNLTADITNLGSATSLTVSDDQGSAVQAVTATGLVTFGPYPNGTDVVLNVEHDQNPDCSVESDAIGQNVCPPTNNECVDAIALTPGNEFSANAIDASVEGSTTSSTLPLPGCASYDGNDIWFSVVVPSDGIITIETGPSSGGETGFDSGLALYSGNCGSLTLINCDDDGAGVNNFSKLSLSGRTPGETIYVRVWEYSGDEIEPFSISAWNVNLSTPSFDLASLKAYPNPVKDVLNLYYTENISQVSIFNLLGQQVLDKKLDASEVKLDMSNLPQGTYLVKVNVDNQVKTLKVVKQ